MISCHVWQMTTVGSDKYFAAAILIVGKFKKENWQHGDLNVRRY